jgi:predicted secreted protein
MQDFSCWQVLATQNDVTTVSGQSIVAELRLETQQNENDATIRFSIPD